MSLLSRCHRAAVCSRQVLRVVLVIALVLIGITAEGCDDGTGLARRGSIRVDVNMTGDDRDPDGFTVSVDGGVARTINASGTEIFSDPEPGVHVVSLGGVADNCAVSGDNPRTVDVTRGDIALTAFDVVCARTTGDLQVWSLTGGLELDGDGYSVTLDGAWSQSVASNGVVIFSFLAPGEHSVELGRLAENCTVLDPNPRTVNVIADTSIEMSFTVACAAPVTVSVAFVSDRDGDFEIYVLWAGTLFPVNVTNDPRTDYGPAWSPDGSEITFCSNRKPLSDTDIYVMNPDRTGLIGLMDDPYPYYDADPA